MDWITDKLYRNPALNQHGNDREGACVINTTNVVLLTGDPPGTNLCLRAEPLHAGAPDHRFPLKFHGLACNVPGRPPSGAGPV
ncbi:hypothetical protein SAMN04487914_13813 [Arthrobacter sp. ok909]|uniref:hypothetical protein n=1 Tax=Arthrobacter sp. ok909 TaxID=1761746 RepID=UPI000885982B|nr:hypothetical protein [Arthrobacter sp. ok909]SDP77703.1 hypothetical protein SAMN04487914_13813 [Arthrobacter sp. ok909]